MKFKIAYKKNDVKYGYLMKIEYMAILISVQYYCYSGKMFIYPTIHPSYAILKL